MATAKTAELCFSNGTEAMWWMDVNCLTCAKYTCYNEKLGRMPKYKCAVQRDIEQQQGGDETINVRSYNAAQNAHCPYKKHPHDKTEKQKTTATEEKNTDLGVFPTGSRTFSAGESLVNADDTLKIAQNNSISAEGNKQAEQLPIKQQTTPQAQKKAAKTQNKPKTYKVTFSPQEVKAAEKRVLDKVWHDEITPSINRGKKIDFERDFTLQENIELVFYPVILSHVVWVYTFRVVDECVSKQIADTKKLTRAVRQLKKEYDAYSRQDLDGEHMDAMERQTNKFMEECNYDFAVMWYSVNNELKKLYPWDEYINLRTNAYCAIIAYRVMMQHLRTSNERIWAKYPYAEELLPHPIMPKLYGLLDAYMSDFTLDVTQNIRLCEAIFSKNLKNIQWGFDN